jgi:hypothetical protein
MAQTLYASFADASLAEKAAGALLDHGVPNQAISIVSRELTTVGDTNTTLIDHSTGEGDKSEKAAKQGLSTTTAGDAAVGAEKGAGIGLGVGIAAALAALLIPGFGLVVGGGALATALAGAAGATAAGAVAGGVHGYLKDQGVPDEAAMNYNHAYETGGAVLSVDLLSGDIDPVAVESILAKYQGVNVNAYGAPTVKTDLAA